MVRRIATWNVNSIRARMDTFISWTKVAQPDVFLLQEIKCIDTQFPREIIEEMGYSILVEGRKSHGGVAILSKDTIEVIERALPGYSFPHARFLHGFTCGMHIMDIYAPNGQALGSNAFAEKEHFYTALQAYMRRALGGGRGQAETFIVGGDFNITPHHRDSADSWEEEGIFCSPQERGWLRALCAEGLTDAIAASLPKESGVSIVHTDKEEGFFPCVGTLYQEQDGYKHAHTKTLSWWTWWDYRGNAFARDKGLRIDHIFTDPWTIDRIVGAGIDRGPRGWERPSDHAPLWIDIA